MIKLIRKIPVLVALVLVVIGVVGTNFNKAPKEPEVVTPEPTEKVTRKIKITATGDCTFATDINASRELGFVAYQERYGNEWFFKNVKGIFENDDLTIVNFEGTLSERGERAIKQFAFRGKPEYAKILSGSSVEAANLANNHSMDYGEISLTDTKMYLEQEGIVHCRGEEDVTITEINGIKVGLVGINYLNDVMRTELESAIKRAKDGGAELIILSIHWGVEKATAPNAEQIEVAHRAIDLGVDLVIGTHPHVLQGFEKYNGRMICYSLGNFSFGGNNSPSDMDTAIYTQTFTFDGDTLIDDNNFEIIPARISSTAPLNNYQPTLAEGAQYERIVDRLTTYTSALGDLQLNFRTQ